MADDRCVNHGGTNIFVFGSCPVCRTLDEQKRIQEDAAERAEERVVRESEEREEHHRKMEEALEADREERERMLEEQQMALDEAQWRQEEALKEAEERQKENLANAYQLESKSKSDQAYELFKAGLYQRSADLAKKAILQDESNIYGYFVQGNALTKLNKNNEAMELFKEAILLLKTPRWNHVAKPHLKAVRIFSCLTEDIRKEVLEILLENSQHLPTNRNSLSILKDLIEYGKIPEATQIFTNINRDNIINGPEWWQVYFDLLSAMNKENIPEKQIKELIQFQLKRTKDNEIKELLITLLFAARVMDKSFIAKSIARISFEHKNEVFGSLQTIKNLGYTIDFDFPDGTVSIIKEMIEEVDEDIWKPTVALRQKENAFANAKAKVEQLKREKEDIRLGWAVAIVFFFGVSPLVLIPTLVHDAIGDRSIFKDQNYVGTLMGLIIALLAAWTPLVIQIRRRILKSQQINEAEEKIRLIKNKIDRLSIKN